MMKKALLSTLIILGLGYSTQSMADVKNLPVICRSQDMNLSTFPSYILSNISDLYEARDELMKNPKLILQHNFINHETKIKDLKLKCPSGNKMIKPFNKKTYDTNKLEISRAYINQIRKWSNLNYTSWKFEMVKFLIFVLSSQTNADYDKYNINEWGCSGDLLPQYMTIRFSCLRYTFEKKQAELNNHNFFEVNWRIIEIPKQKTNTEDLQKMDLSIALNNIPNICSSSSKKPFILLGEMGWGGVFNYEKEHKKFVTLIKILSEHPSLFFSKYFGYHILDCDPPWMSTYRRFINSEPFEKEALKRGEYKFRKAYLNHVKKLKPEDKERLKFLINLITLNDNILLPSYVDDKTKKTFKINYGNLITAYDQLKNNEAYQFVRKVNQARVVFKILLLLL